eukprot:TRINITY_DN107897_c0_g1_i1.p1 TRINITY_DN107897_c0_g1~~TRINITY_DN107897_c0_g1_i1.p1  ORF type:complete len:199 (+),score=42.65 TRINITY_DN107897_c0_g1_i1:22-618(+)
MGVLASKEGPPPSGPPPSGPPPSAPMAAFTVSAATITGDEKIIGDLYGDMSLRDFRNCVALAYDAKDFELLIMYEGEVVLPAQDFERLSDLGIKEGASILVSKLAWVRDIFGRWEPAPEDNSDWMKGMHIKEDGSFSCKRGSVRDGMLRVIHPSERKINLKRTCEDANDHVFTVEEDGAVMKGRCIQSGCTYTLTKQA